MTLTIHWSKCDAPMTQVISDIIGVQVDATGMKVMVAWGEAKVIEDIDLADSWEVKR